MRMIQDQYVRAWRLVTDTASTIGPAGWDAPSPCAGWTAGHVAGHLVDAARQTAALLAGAPPLTPTHDPAALRALAGGDPAARLREAAAPLLAVVRALNGRTGVPTPRGDLPADQFLTMAMVEPAVHGWDLAVACGADARLDDDVVASLLALAEAMGGQLAATGMYASALPVPDGSGAQDRLLALLGRRTAGTITGSAAGVPFTALPPTVSTDSPAPLIVTWHMLDAPRTDAAFAAAMPLSGVPAWRVHLGMPMCGARMVDGRVDAVLELAREDVLLAFLAPFVRQAAQEFPAALAALRDQLPTDDGPVGLLGASLGGAVALQVVATAGTAIGSIALVNPAVRIRSAVGMAEGIAGRPYAWTAEADGVAAELDFVARAGEIAAQPPLLLVSGGRDHPDLRADAVALVETLRARYEHPDDVELITVPGMAHPLAEEPGLTPAPQSPEAVAVDGTLPRWFRQQVGSDQHG